MDSLRVSVVVLLGSLVIASCGGDEETAPSRILLSGKKVYSNQDVIIRDFFGDRRDGVFVDIGCFHWKKGNNTLYLEERLGWTGVSVDALAYLESGYLENRPGTRFLNYIVSDRSGEMATIYVQGALSSTSADHLELYPGLEEARGEPIEVETVTMDDLLERAGIEKIDFLNMDIEEGEPRALAGFDIERFRPELVCIEANKRVRSFLTEYFDRHGYQRIEEYLDHDSYNWYFEPK